MSLVDGLSDPLVSRPLTDHRKQLEPVKMRAQFAASIAGSGAYTGAEVTDGLTFLRWDEAWSLLHRPSTPGGCVEAWRVTPPLNRGEGWLRVNNYAPFCVRSSSLCS